MVTMYNFVVMIDFIFQENLQGKMYVCACGYLGYVHVCVCAFVHACA